MFGIFFNFNPNLSRILTDYGFKGHPLRKDFPLTGFFEIFYNDVIKSIVFSSVLLTQDYRIFSNNLQTLC
jgi:NADH-quinone oxidoreductase subunit C